MVESLKALFKKTILFDWYRKIRPSPGQNIKQAAVKEYAARFGTPILIETGTYYGDMIEAMKKEFRTLYSIELEPQLYARAKKRLAKYQNIKIINGDSAEKLPEILETINEKCLFWLDGHYSGAETAKGNLKTPIIQELKTIFNHQIKDHVILIDDARCFNGKNDYPTIKKLKEYVMRKSQYKNFEIKDDIIRIH